MLLAGIASVLLVTSVVAEDNPVKAVEQQEIPIGSAAQGEESLPSIEELLQLPTDAMEPQVAPPVAVEVDPTKIFPDPPSPFPDPPAQQNGPLNSMVQQLTSAARTACAGRDDCVRVAGNFARFLWNNRDKADMQTRAATCLGQSALKRGYVRAPMDAIRNASTAEMMDLSVEVCECVICFLGKFGLCRTALVQGKIVALMSLFNRKRFATLHA